MTASSLSPRTAARLLHAAALGLRAELDAMPAPLTAFHPAPGEWCAKEVIGHLIEAERRGFAGRIRVILGADAPRLEGWDQNEVAKARHDCERDAKTLVDELVAMREESVALVAGLTDADLARVGHHPKVGVLTAGHVLHEWLHHDRNHLKQIQSNLQHYVWPFMGNAQKFSED